MINQQPRSYMIEHAVREWWNNKISEQRCYNNRELGCRIKSGFACSNIREQPAVDSPSCIQYVETWLNNCYFTNAVLMKVMIMSTVFLQGFFYSLWYFYARTLYNVWYVHRIVVECTSRYILFRMVNCHLYARYVKYWLAVLWIEIMNSLAWFQANVNCFSLKESDICFWKKRRHNILRGSCILLLKNNMNAYFITSRCPTFLRI